MVEAGWIFDAQEPVGRGPSQVVSYLLKVSLLLSIQYTHTHTEE